MKIRLSIDRLEWDKKPITALFAEDGTAINFARVLFPRGEKVGDTWARVAIGRIKVREGLTRRGAWPSCGTGSRPRRRQ